MPALGKRVRTDPATAKSFLAKSEQFLAGGQAALARQQYDAALLLAVHAAISANDAATVHIGRVRSTDPDHLKAADLLESLTGDADKAKQLRGLLRVKSDVEYQSARTAAKAAADGIARAERLVDWARRLLG